MTAPAETLTVQEILLRAADHIEREGLQQRDFLAAGWRDLPVSELACCAAGGIRIGAGMTAAQIAVGYVSFEDHSNFPTPKIVEEAEELLAEHLIRLGQTECRNGDDLNALETIATWNDQEGMTAAEVAEILRDVAEMAR